MPIDTDIFGAAADQSKDSDIFKDLPASKSKSQEATPETAGSMFKRYAMDTGRGLLMAGPMGAALGASKIGNELLDKAAYNAGGSVTDFASNRGASPEVAAGLGYGANVAMQVVPTLAGGEASKLLSPAVVSAGRSLMSSAIKPTIADLKTGDAAKAIDTLLTEGIAPTKSGLERLRSMIEKLGDEVSTAISGSNETVKVGNVGTRLMDTYNKFRAQATPQADLEAIKKAWMDFRNHPDLIGKEEMPVQLAQQLKQGTYRSLGDKPYGELQGASVEAQKTLARGMKEEIAAKVPEVAPKLQRQSELLNAAEIAERRALMEANKNPAGLALLAPNASRTAAFLADRSAYLKALAAMGLFHNAQAIPANAARLTLGDLMLQRGQLQPGSVDLGALYPQQ